MASAEFEQDSDAVGIVHDEGGHGQRAALDISLFAPDGEVSAVAFIRLVLGHTDPAGLCSLLRGMGLLSGISVSSGSLEEDAVEFLADAAHEAPSALGELKRCFAMTSGGGDERAVPGGHRDVGFVRTDLGVDLPLGRPGRLQ